MATQLFCVNIMPSATQRVAGTGWYSGSGGGPAGILRTTRGSGVTSQDATTTTGPTAGVDIAGEFVTEPVSADVTISGVITANIWAAENNMSANVAINFVVEVLRADGTSATIVRSARVTEVAVTTRAVNNFTATPGAGVLVNKGDRIRVRFFGDDAGTMAAGFSFQVGYSGTTAAADGDTYITFTENFSFMAAPTGTDIYLTDTASDVVTASVDRRAWTSRGAGVQTDVVDPSGGAAFQWTDTAGGTEVDWFTPQLQAFTLADMIECNLRLAEANASGLQGSHPRVEIARVNADGTNPVVFGTWMGDGKDGVQGLPPAVTEGAYTVWVSGDDLVFSNGHRIRIRLIADLYKMVPSREEHVTLWYAGTSAGASGDSWIKLNQTVTEYVPATTGPPRPGRASQRALLRRRM